jgi:chromosome segregation ATPase
MTGEEMERAIAFIIEQQAQFAANRQRHEEILLKHGETMNNHEEFMRDHEAVMRDHEERMRDHEERMRDHAEGMRDHAEGMRDHDERMRRIEGTQEKTALQIQHLGGAMVELAEAHTRTENTLAETNGKLNALINTVERHIAEGRNGKA